MSHALRQSWTDRLFRNAPELGIVLLVLGLTLLGLTVLFSVGRNSPGSASGYVVKQALWLVIALGAFAFTSRLNLERLRRLWWLPAVVAVLLLMAVLIPGIGVKVNGARRWLDLGPMRMQVSDFAKVSMVYVLAHYLAANQRRLGEFLRGYCVPCVIIGCTCGLIILQPDFGTTALCGAVGGVMLFWRRRWRYLVPSVMAAVGAFAVAVALDPVRLKRVTVFLDVEGNRSDGAYQLWQGILAFGAGGLQGVGLGNGRQQMAFLPEAHTDFIFPIIGEELGLVCTASVVIAFLGLFLLVTHRLRQAPNLFQFLLVTGSLGFIIVQAMINLAVVTGLAPTKGMSLPFISYGGSNLLSMFIFLGIIFNCFAEWDKNPLPRPSEIAT